MEQRANETKINFKRLEELKAALEVIKANQKEEIEAKQKEEIEEIEAKLKEIEELKEEIVKEEQKIGCYTLVSLTFLCIGIFYLIKLGTVIGYVMSAILASVEIFFFFSAIKKTKKRIKQKWRAES